MGCGFVTSTSLTSQTGALVPPKTRPLLAQSVNPLTRETLRDFAMNQRFRSDLFVRDVRRMTSKEQLAKLGEMCLMPVTTQGEVNLAIKTSYGDIQLEPDSARVEASHRLNRELCRQASLGDDMQCLASPVVGAGVRLTHLEQLFLHFRPSEEANVEAWARDVLNNIVEKQKLRVDYQKSVTDMSATLTKFMETRLPYLRERNVVF